MPRGFSVDIDALHAMLYRRSDRLDRIRIRQTELVLELGLTKFTVSRLIKRMVEEERLVQLSTKSTNAGAFKVVNPEVWNVVHTRA